MSSTSERLAAALADRYVIERELGSGATATVYLARELKHGRRVAIKVLREELTATFGAERFLREIEIAAKLAHPHILALFDSGRAGGFVYYVTPYADGESLSARLSRDGKLPLTEAVGIADQVARALAYAHEKGVVHRDVKPANILLSGDQAVVADFGIARALDLAGGERLTGTGQALGTPAYMSPEQVLGSPEIDARSDVYSLGCVVYEMITGQAPFEGPTVRALMTKHVVQTAPSLKAMEPTVPDRLDGAVARALAKDPVDRYPHAGLFAEALSGAALREPEPHGRGRWWMGAVAALLIAAAVAIPKARDLMDGVFGSVGARVEPIRLVVLPFRNLTGDPAQEYFADGMTEQMIEELGRLDPERLAVIAFTSAMHYKDSQAPIDQIGTELGVSYLLESSVRRERSLVRVDARLVRLRDQRTVLDSTYDRELTGILQLQSDVARSIAASLRLTLLPDVETRLAGAPMVDSLAHEAYLAGMFQLSQMTPGNLDAALDYFEEALRHDSLYAPAYVGIAQAWTFRSFMGYVSPTEAAPNTSAAARKAIALDSTASYAHEALALVASNKWDGASAEAEFRKAIALDGNEAGAHAGYSVLLAEQRDSAGARSEIELALRLDPHNPFYRVISGRELLVAGRYGQAIDQFQAGLRLSPGMAPAQCGMWEAYTALDRLDLAFEEARRCLGPYGPVVAEALSRGWDEGGYVAAMRGAADVLDRGIAGVHVGPTDPIYTNLFAGRKDRALEALAKAVEARDPNVPILMASAQVRAGLGDEGRFAEILAEVGRGR